MKHRSEFNGCFNDFIFVKMKALNARVRHYHADGQVDLISKEILGVLKKIGSTCMELSRHS